MTPLDGSSEKSDHGRDRDVPMSSAVLGAALTVPHASTRPWCPRIFRLSHACSPSIRRAMQVLSSSSANASGNLWKVRGSRWYGRLSRLQPTLRLLVCVHPCRMPRASTQLLMATACTTTVRRLRLLGGGSTLQVDCCFAAGAASMPRPGRQPSAVALLRATGVRMPAHLSTVPEQQLDCKPSSTDYCTRHD